MNTLTDEQKSILIGELKSIGIYTPKIVRDIDNITFPVLLIINHTPRDNTPPVSFALSLNHFPDGPLEPKCWITEQDLKPLREERGPQPHPEYKKFVYEGRVFYPFSIDPKEYSFRAESILDLINALYEHTDTAS